MGGATTRESRESCFTGRFFFEDAGKAAVYNCSVRFWFRYDRWLAFLCSLARSSCSTGAMRTHFERAIADAFFRTDAEQTEEERTESTSRSRRRRRNCRRRRTRQAAPEGDRRTGTEVEHMPDEIETAEHLPHTLEAKWEEGDRPNVAGHNVRVFRLNNVDRDGPRSWLRRQIGSRSTACGPEFVMVTSVATAHPPRQQPATWRRSCRRRTSRITTFPHRPRPPARRGRNRASSCTCQLFWLLDAQTWCWPDNLFKVFGAGSWSRVCSVCLIGFYFERKSAGDAPNKAFITTASGRRRFFTRPADSSGGYLGTLTSTRCSPRSATPIKDDHGHHGGWPGVSCGRPWSRTTKGGEPLAGERPGRGGRYAVIFRVAMGDGPSAEQ